MPASYASSQPRRQLLKAQSVGSISSESLTISSLWEAPSYDTIPDFLSSLGFDDFESPELIPDRCVVPCPQSPSIVVHCCPMYRFIPPELDFVRPSLMRQATLGSVSTDSFHLEPLTPPPPDGTAATEDGVSSKPFFEGHSHSSACSVLHRMILTNYMSHHRLLPFTSPPTHS